MCNWLPWEEQSNYRFFSCVFACVSSSSSFFFFSSLFPIQESPGILCYTFSTWLGCGLKYATPFSILYYMIIAAIRKAEPWGFASGKEDSDLKQNCFHSLTPCHAHNHKLRVACIHVIRTVCRHQGMHVWVVWPGVLMVAQRTKDISNWVFMRSPHSRSGRSSVPATQRLYSPWTHVEGFCSDRLMLPGSFQAPSCLIHWPQCNP